MDRRLDKPHNTLRFLPTLGFCIGLRVDGLLDSMVKGCRHSLATRLKQYFIIF
jgi:hypothetical protein